MAQRLALPINQMRITVGYKHPWYPKNPSTKGLTHYGVDCTYMNRTSTVIYGLGKGKVTHAGYDNLLGNVVVIVYKTCECPDGKIRNLAVRYCHLKSISVKVGQEITLDSKLGHIGSTGKLSSGVHLHFEIDADINYPHYSPTLSKNSNIIKASPKGYPDTTLDPVKCLWMKRTHPENQQVSIGYNDSVAASDTAYKNM